MDAYTTQMFEDGGAGSTTSAFWDSGFGSSLGAILGDAATIGIGALNSAAGGYQTTGLYPYEFGQPGYGYTPLANNQQRAAGGSLGIIVLVVAAYLIFRK